MSLKKLYSGRDALEAHYLCDLLKADGIDAVVMGESLGSGRGDLPVTCETLPAVYVREGDLERALVRVKEFQNQASRLAATPPAPWTCPNCREQVEGQFSHCWQCQTPRPATVV